MSDGEKLVERLREMANRTPPVCQYDHPKEVEVLGKQITVYCKPFEQFQDLMREAADAIVNGVTVRKPINTNADCIRNMNDDVLGVAISQMIIKEVESALCSEGKVPTATGLAFLCAGVRDRVEMWLRQECE